MKYLIIYFLLALIGCSSPVRIVESYSTDSTGKTIKTITKYYDSSPVVHREFIEDHYYSNPYYYRPFGYGYYPRTQIVVPIRPSYGPRYTPRNNPHH
jgi:predicted N-acyltransferase